MPPSPRCRSLFAIVLAVPLILVPTVDAAQVVEAESGARGERVAEGLAVPVDVAFGPDGSLYYVELQDGGLRRIAPGASSPDPEPLWTAPDVQTGGERGLVGLALDPDFETTGAFYVYYTHNLTGTPENRLSKVVDGEETVLLDGIEAGYMHNSGRLAFLPDRTLLVSVGDATLDTKRNEAVWAHDPEDPHGKVLRLNRDGSVPDDNPWGTAAWTKGHRNVFGLATAPDGQVLATENGPHHDDEVNALEAGNDYGWPTCLGDNCTDSEWGAEHLNATEPVLAFTPTIGPTGATWYRGHFYWADVNHGRIHRAVPLENGTWEDQIVAQLDGGVLDVEAGPDGLYVSTWSDIHRLELDDKWLTAEPFTFAPVDDGQDDPGDETPDPVADEQATIPGPGIPLALAALGLAARRGLRGRSGRW